MIMVGKIKTGASLWPQNPHNTSTSFGSSQPPTPFFFLALLNKKQPQSWRDTTNVVLLKDGINDYISSRLYLKLRNN